jgi:hypothetical protein
MDGFIGSRWNSSIFQAALQLRLLSDLPASIERLQCRYCPSRRDSTTIASSLHALSCGINRGLRNLRHNAICKELKTLLQRAYANVNIETEPIIWQEDTRTIRGDLRYYIHGEQVILDVGVACPTSHISGANEFNSAYHECGAADDMELRKKRHVANVINRGFHPFVLESSGRIGRSASLFLSRICQSRKELRTSFFYNVSTYCAQESSRMLKFLRDKVFVP